MRYFNKTEKRHNISATDFSLKKLSYGMKSEAELRRLMKAAGYADGDIEDTVRELKDFGYIDDERYVEEFYRFGRARGWSKRRIMRELFSKGVDGEISREIVEELSSETDEEEEAFLIAKKMLAAHLDSGKPFDEKIKAKIGRRLISSGYNEGICYRVIYRLRQEEL